MFLSGVGLVQGGVLAECVPLVPAVDLDQGRLGGRRSPEGSVFLGIVVVDPHAVPFDPGPPLTQFAFIPPEDVLCRGGLELAIAHDGKAVCVKPSSAAALTECGYLAEIAGL